MLVTLYAIFGLIVIVVVYLVYKRRELRLKKQLEELNKDANGKVKNITDSTRSKLRKDITRVQRTTNREVK